MKWWVLTFNTSASLFERVGVCVDTAVTVQLVPGQVPCRAGSYSILARRQKRSSRVVRRCNPVVGQRMFHVFLNHLASRHWTHQVLQLVVYLSSLNFYLHVAECEEMHKSLRTEVCLVLRRFKVPVDDVSIISTHTCIFGTYLIISRQSSITVALSFCSFWRNWRRELGDIFPGDSLV